MPAPCMKAAPPMRNGNRHGRLCRHVPHSRPLPGQDEKSRAFPCRMARRRRPGPEKRTCSASGGNGTNLPRALLFRTEVRKKTQAPAARPAALCPLANCREKKTASSTVPAHARARMPYVVPESRPQVPKGQSSFSAVEYRPELSSTGAGMPNSKPSTTTCPAPAQKRYSFP